MHRLLLQRALATVTASAPARLYRAPTQLSTQALARAAALSSSSNSSNSSSSRTRWLSIHSQRHHRPPHVALQKRMASTSAVDEAAATAATAAGNGAQAHKRVTRVAVGQMTAVGDQQTNLATCTRLAQEAKSKGAKMLFLPECFSFIGTSQQESLAAAQPLDGPLMQQYQQLARYDIDPQHLNVMTGDTGLWLSLGGFQEVGPDATHIYNTHVLLNDQGVQVSRYRKVHLFDVDVPQGPVLMESRTTAPGDQLVVCSTPAGRVALTVCYDLRFPELYQQLVWDMNAQVLTVPSAFTKVTGQAHWEVLLRARAIECQAWVVAAAQAGRHNEKRESFGHSLIIDPWGVVVARLGDPLGTGVAVADVDLDQLDEVRTKMPIQQHRAKGHLAYWHGAQASK